jgi:hypothetical protein
MTIPADRRTEPDRGTPGHRRDPDINQWRPQSRRTAREVFMRPFLTIFAIAVVALGLGLSGGSTAHAAALQVCKHGCPFETITAALAAANAGDTIVIGKGLYKEDLRITKNIALVGEGSQNTTIKGSNSPGITVGAGVSANINALGVSASHNSGILNSGVLVAVNVEVSHAEAHNFGGGGIHNLGNMTLVNSTVCNNKAFPFGGGIYNHAGARLTLQGTAVHNNTASAVGGGIYNAGAVGDVVLQASTVTNNKPDNCFNVAGC